MIYTIIQSWSQWKCSATRNLGWSVGVDISALVKL